MGKNKNKDKGHVRAVPEPPEQVGHERNPGMPLVLDWVRDVRVNRSAVERRAATIPTRRSVKKQWQALSDSTTEKWDATKRGFELAWQDFQREWEKAGN